MPLRSQTGRKQARRVLRKTSLIEGLESRAMFSITVAANGVTGTMEDAGPVQRLGSLPRPRGSGSSDGDPGYQITLNFAGGLTTSQRAIFTQAANVWQSIITQDIPDYVSLQYGEIDDIYIEARGVPIDGVGKILGRAGPTEIRSDTGLTTAGIMQFDSADLANLEASGTLDEVITHEMGHVIGIGSLWNIFGLVTGRVADGGTDPRYIGTAALAEYHALAGNLSLSNIPVENTGGSGTQDAHWRENGVGSLGNELMTGFLNGTMANPLSRISAASLIDMGYPGVNLDAADLYTLPQNPSASYAATNPLPTVGTLVAPFNVASGSGFNLTLSNASDDSAVGSVSFYRESNGIPGLQATGTATPDTLIVSNSGGSNLTATVPAGLAAGNYTFYARAADNFGALSAVASTTVTISTVAAPVTPSTPALLASQDTGDSNGDGITRLNVLTFTGTTSPNAAVTLYRDGSTAIGTGIADAAGNYSVTTSALADGTFAVTAVASSAGGTSAPSGGRTISVDTVAPAVVSATYDRETTQAITLTLDDVLAGRLLATSGTLENLTTGSIISSTVGVGGSGTVATLGRPSLLADGNYRFTLPASALTDVAGNPLVAPVVLTFRQLAGDADNNGIVNFNDLVLLAQNYGKPGKTFSGGNFDYSSDGVVTFSDLVILAQNFNKSLAAFAAVTAPAVTDPDGGTKTTTKRGSAANIVG